MEKRPWIWIREEGIYGIIWREESEGRNVVILYYNLKSVFKNIRKINWHKILNGLAEEIAEYDTVEPVLKKLDDWQDALTCKDTFY